MEESINSSSVDGAPGSKVGSASSEESGWTMYLEDFMASEEKQEAGGFYSSAVNGPSAISDAASCVAWTPLSLKKRKRKGLLEDDSLEDTAISPASSSKVTDLNYLTMNPTKKDDHRETPQEGVVGSRSSQELNGLSSTERKNECTEQKKNGVCLVPLSMLVHYLG
ncbi:vascular-related unknown protein 1-like [Musa acuminata AAA Group]|uniref:(wild Malaysian banana) hypothetical protein n=1 Tax=Musa acuminata subsp. malaccensis TaxID=214687 RepID=A0A804JMC5_MUSAM|nr:PREDICTED: uncharacterized protein LOC103989845 [Musa acuminata subsp. malaccensis]CAG1847929.1 unnamed protein product [Musa acuminata subsp. malaccensis]